MDVPDRLLPWVLRAAWVLLPFTVGPALAGALHQHSTQVEVVGATGCWILWVSVLVATLVPHPIGLTVLRCIAPALAAGAAAAISTGTPSALASALGAGSAAFVVVLTFLPQTGLMFVNGPAYPNERRFLLAVPGALLLGPVELAWLAAVCGPVAAALLLATGKWIPGGIVLVVAGVTTTLLGRALHGLSRRWVVFVPAGLVLHDPMSLADPVLFRRQVIDTMGPAPAASDSLDLTQRAMGLALELRLTEKVPMARITPKTRHGEPGASARLLFTPTRPGAVLAEAATRRFRVAG
ncbi:MAG: hypothetical protein NVS3B21_20810 [Acidimicrobiales bacterium]